MIDHVMLKVRDYEASKAFYAAALMPLGMKVIKEPSAPGLLSCYESAGPGIPRGGPGCGPTRRPHAAALAAGATDNGGPGFRPQYHSLYYGAFVHDPNGYNIEAAKHMPEGALEWMSFLGLLLRSLVARLLGAVGLGAAAAGAGAGRGSGTAAAAAGAKQD